MYFVLGSFTIVLTVWLETCKKWKPISNIAVHVDRSKTFASKDCLKYLQFNGSIWTRPEKPEDYEYTTKYKPPKPASMEQVKSLESD